MERESDSVVGEKAKKFAIEQSRARALNSKPSNTLHLRTQVRTDDPRHRCHRHVAIPLLGAAWNFFAKAGTKNNLFLTH